MTRHPALPALKPLTRPDDDCGVGVGVIGTVHDNTGQWADQDGTGQDSGPAPEDKAERKSAATMLVEIARELYEFGVSPAGETFGVPRSGPTVVRLLRGGKTSLRAQLSREYFRRHGRTTGQQALADALLVVEGIAQDTPEQPLHLRVADRDGAWWLDLGDATGRAVRINTAGWAVQDSPPVLFKRTALNSPLPEPAPGGQLAELWNWLNVNEADRPLVAAWLVAVLATDLPHPVLGLFGEQGTGKSTAAKVLGSLLDPSPVPLRKPPRDPDSWVTAAAGSWVVGLDNLSDIPPWLSDSICRAVTGDGDVRRKLYTDGDLTVFAFRRCLILNGIDLGTIRGDLAERLLPIQLDTINEHDRREENDLWPAWTHAHPRLLGAVLDLTANVRAALPTVQLDTKPRMADFARILATVDQTLGTNGLARYLHRQGELATDTLTGDPFITTIANHLTTNSGFTGTATELLNLATPTDDKWRTPKNWPTTARHVTQRLKRQAPVMRKAGWTIHNDNGRNKDKTVHWTIHPPARDAGNPDPPDPPDPSSQVTPGAGGGSTQPDGGSRGSPAGQQHPPGGSWRGNAGSETRQETAGHNPQAGQAGQAGNENGTSQDDGQPPCCGNRPRGVKGRPIVPACKLCPASPTYYRNTA